MVIFSACREGLMQIKCKISANFVCKLRVACFENKIWKLNNAECVMQLHGTTSGHRNKPKCLGHKQNSFLNAVYVEKRNQRP